MSVMDVCCTELYQKMHDAVLIGASEAKPLSSGWCENRKFGTSQLCNSFWYVAVAQYFTLYGTFAALRNSLGGVACLRNRLSSLVGK